MVAHFALFYYNVMQSIMFNINEKDAPKPRYKFGYSNSNLLQLKWQWDTLNGHTETFLGYIHTTANCITNKSLWNFNGG